MKSTIKYSLLLIAALFALLALPACKTTPEGTKVIDPYVATNAAPILNTAVSGAVIYGYTKDPTNTTMYARVVRVALNEFLLSEDLSGPALQARLYSLPFPALKTAEAQLIITPVIAAYKAFADRYIKAGIKRDPSLVALIQALIDGIDQGLDGIAVIQSGGTPPTSSTDPLDSFETLAKAMTQDIQRRT